MATTIVNPLPQQSQQLQQQKQQLQQQLQQQQLQNGTEIYAEELVPPQNFTMVSSGVYRSAFPKKKNFSFLRQLRLKSVLYASHSNRLLALLNIHVAERLYWKNIQRLIWNF